MSVHKKKFLCLEPDDMRLQGDWDAESVSLITINVEKCQGHDYCKNETEMT